MLIFGIRSDPTLPSCCFGFRVATAPFLSRQNIAIRRQTNVSMLRIDVGGGEKMREDICWINVMRTHWIVRGDLRQRHRLRSCTMVSMVSMCCLSLFFIVLFIVCLSQFYDTKSTLSFTVIFSFGFFPLSHSA